MPIDLKKKSDSEGAMYIRSKRTRVFKLSQEEFAEKFSVQLGTLRNWEQGISEPPSYFRQLVALEEEKLGDTYYTPIERVRDSAYRDVEKSSFRKCHSEQAKRMIIDDESQLAVYNVAMDMIREEGIIENLQKVSSYFDNYGTTDIAALAQLLLLQNIDAKLGELLKVVSAK